jgi:hypothetical protein
MAEKWKVSGTYFEACNCVLPCPCIFPNSPNIPTGGDCTVLVAWHGEHGRFGEVVLDGLNVAWAVYSPGDMGLGNWQVALYLDEKASESQKNALAQIFGGKAGGRPADLAAAFGKVLGISSKKMDYHANGKTRSLEIAGVAKAEIEAIEGQGGAEVTINNLAHGVAPGYPTVQAQSKKLSYNDHGMNWEISGKNGFYSPFAYQSD